MAPTENLGALQQQVMLATVRLGDDAYGASIQQSLGDVTGRAVTIATVYVTMERLEQRGLVRSRMGDATPVRGGKPKRIYSVTKTGISALRVAHDELSRAWDGLETHPAFRST